MKKSQALEILAQKIATCQKCQELSEYRAQCDYKTVPGTGNPNANVLIIGEAPGRNEAEQGEPFVGKAGKLLTNILEAVGLSREEVFITNILKCRPPENRDPEAKESKNCRPFLDLQIELIDPIWIICLGRYAARYILGKNPDTPMGAMRGQHEVAGKKVIATYHPSYLLRNPSAKKEVANDLKPLIFDLRNGIDALQQ
jgi:uracil-DNA glycosylase family 4